ncbi:MAG: hypothetical protein K6F93_06395 [Lachnospiraceae bacterium]|nr:hypothetical protein [Lachnospiraceae bacterium]
MTVLALVMVVCIVVYDPVGFKTTEVKADQSQTPVQYSFYNEGNGTLKIEKKDANGNLLSSAEGTIKVNKKGTETIKSTTKNAFMGIAENAKFVIEASEEVGHPTVS